MKKVLLVLTLMLMAAPVWADITVTASKVGSEVTLSYLMDAPDANLPRAFALEVSLTQENDAKINGDPYELSSDFWVYPGTIDINDNGTIDSNGTPVAYNDGNMMIIEMGSLYHMGVDPAPDDSGVLLKFLVTADCNVLLAENAARGGVDSNGVVMEDTTKVFLASYVKLVGSAGGDEEPVCATCRGDWSGDDQVEWNADLLAMLGKLNAANFFLSRRWYTEAEAGLYAALEWRICGDWNSDGKIDWNTDLLPILGKLNQANFMLGSRAYPCCHAVIDPCPE